MPAGSKMDPPLAKAKSVSDSGSASGEKPVQLQLGRGVRRCERNNSADTQIEALLVSPEFKQPTLFANKDLMHNDASEVSGVALHKLRRT
ncbi:acid sphingomyelinase-like phosphodiesterase 3b [Grus japonensis]|uniref:Acid sphingomyelinase-like phosphodiesterase 3b n=1 Tax=Grus japonensis TaxID=30415 RepID=A0ABC9XXP8_GRUJA